MNDTIFALSTGFVKSAIAIVNKERFLFYYHYIYYIISLFLPLMALFYTKIKIKGVEKCKWKESSSVRLPGGSSSTVKKYFDGKKVIYNNSFPIYCFN